MSAPVNSGDSRDGGPSRQVGEHAAEQTTRDTSAPYRSGGDGDDGMDRSAKRRRVTVACAHCRYRKSRCDGLRPRCSTCVAQDLDCVYSHSGPLNTATASKEHRDSLDLRLQTVERHLERLSGRVGRLEHVGNGDPGAPMLPDAASSQQIAEELIDENEPRSVVDSVDATDGIGSIRFSDEENAGFFGPSSNIALTRDIVSATTSSLNRAGAKSVPDWQGSGSGGGFMHSHVLRASRPPSPVPDRPSATGQPPDAPANPFDMPPPDRTLQLVLQYFENTGLLFPYIHRESFLATYHDAAATGFRRVRRSWLGLLNMVLAMAVSASYLDERGAQRRMAESGVFFHRAMALCERQIRFGASLEIVQFLLLMSQYLQGTESSVQTWNVHGLAVKASYQLGLHSMHALSRYDPLEREMRIRTWYGCVLLDRTLSMTLGRPSLIPETHVRVDRPREIPPPSVPSPFGPLDVSLADASLEFYNATISLYMIMGRVLDVMYGSNLGCDKSQDIFSLASQVLQIEHQLSEAQRSFPSSLRLAEAADLTHETGSLAGPLLKFRIIYTLRYHNLRILTHRPLLHRYLEILSSPAEDAQQISALSQVGMNSLRICIQSAGSIVELVSHLTSSGKDERVLMGAWWFSLYYTFNAALVLYSGLLIRACAETHSGLLPLGDVPVRRELLPLAIQSLRSLDKDNRMTEKCARYTMKLDRVLAMLDPTQHMGNSGVPAQADQQSFVAGAPMGPGLLSHETTPLGVDWSEFMVPGDLDFLNTFDLNTFAL